ncbi:p450 domain-containing protein, partial [Cephalotus follicularis]
MASMEFLFSPITFTALALILSFFTIKVLTRKPNINPKKSKYHPIGGTIFNQLLNFKRIHHYNTDLAAKYRTYRLITPFRNEIYTSDPANVEYMLKTNFANYGKGNYNYTLLNDLLGDGIFAVDGDKWRQQRKVSSHEFTRKNIRDFSSVVFQKNAAKLANIVSEAAKTNRSMDIRDLFMKSTLDSIFKVAFGVELDSMGGSSEEDAKFSKAFDDASAMTIYRYVDILWKIKKFLIIGSEAALKRNTEVIDNFVYKIIRNKTEQMRNSQDDTHMKKEDILSRFLLANETDQTYLRDIILNIMIAGKDTTAATLSWFIYMLCKYPAIQEKVAQEVKQATNMKHVTDVNEFANSISEEVLEKMHYLHAVLTETLRLYPAVPLDPKICFCDDTLPDGFSVRKGDMVVYQPYAMGRMRFIWGDTAEEFQPQRWLGDDGKFRPESPFKFTAFQAGPRICLGKEFAYTQMKIFSAVLLRFFVFKMSDEKKPVNYRPMMTLHIDGGLHVVAYPLALVLSFFTIKVLTRKPNINPKKSKYHPIGGTIFNQLLNFKRIHHYNTDLAAKYRTYRLITPFRNEVYTSDPANVEYMLKTNFANYGKGNYNYTLLNDLLGDGIFAVDGDKWRQQRKVSSHEFTRKNLRDFSSVVFQKNVAKLANIVSEAAKTNQSMDIQDLFMKSTLDSIFKVAFGVELDSLGGSSEEGAKFSKAFDDASAMTLYRYVDILWKIKKFLNIGSEAALKRNTEVMDNFVYKLIRNKTEQMRNSQDDTHMKKEDILSRFLLANETDPTYLRDIILNIIIAGKDTTAATLSWFIYMLCKYPTIQEKVAEEVKQATNMKHVTDVNEFANSISEEVLGKMHYLHAVLTETLRLYPAVPLDPKICFCDDTLPDGFSVRKGDMVAYQPYAMGRMRFIWGDTAEEFQPQRWLGDDGKFRPESPFKFTAFQVS